MAVERPLDSVLQARFAEITAMDRAIGKLRQSLDAQGVRQNTLLWYCGDNGVPPSGIYNTPLRGQKAMMYEGGVRVPGIIEWPQGIPTPRTTKVNAVTSDMLPTLTELTGQPLPDRPIDGTSLMPLIRGEMEERPEPICFWDFETGHIVAADPEPYIDPELQVGTTPLAKIMDGQYTRSFRNYHHPEITDADYAGERAILDNRYKLVIDGQGSEVDKELFDMTSDPAEQHNIIDSEPEVAEKLEQQLTEWQQSVLQSLTGADYR